MYPGGLTLQYNLSKWILEISGQLYLQPPSQNPFFLNPHANSVFLHSRKRQASVKDTFLAFQGCPLTTASTVMLNNIIVYQIIIIFIKRPTVVSQL